MRGREGREPRAPKGKEKEEENKSRVVRARAKPDALPRGPLRGFGKYLLSLPRKRHPFSGAFLRGREGREPRAPKGKEKEEENKSRVVRARAKPDALPRGPPQGFRQIPTVSAKARIRAHLALFLPDSDFGHLRLSKLPHPHI